jgi:hypothetical protein
LCESCIYTWCRYAYYVHESRLSRAAYGVDAYLRLMEGFALFTLGRSCSCTSRSDSARLIRFGDASLLQGGVFELIRYVLAIADQRNDISESWLKRNLIGNEDRENSVVQNENKKGVRESTFTLMRILVLLIRFMWIADLSVDRISYTQVSKDVWPTRYRQTPLDSQRTSLTRSHCKRSFYTSVAVQM